MKNFPDQIIRSRAKLVPPQSASPAKKEAEEGGCGVIGFASSVKVPGRHIFRPMIQMHNRGNGKGGGIAAAGLDPDYLGVTPEVLKSSYLLQVALLDRKAASELEEKFIRPFFEIAYARDLPTIGDWRSLDLPARPPDVKRYFVRVKKDVLDKFSGQFGDMPLRDKEDEFVWQNSFKINRKYYSSLGEKRAFVLSHGRDLAILKIVGYAEDVIRYYQLEDMPAHIWIGHQRYPTKGRVWHPGGAHPFIGMNEALVHNGDFANYHSVSEYLKQRNIVPQFLTDTEISVMVFDLWSRVYRYPLEYAIEGLAPTTELDFDRLPAEKRRIYEAIQRVHMHASPDGPWFFIIARSRPDDRELQLIGITDTSMLRPQVFALSEGEVQIGLCASEKQAIDATLESLSQEDDRFRPVADRYWNARGGSHNDGGAFVFRIRKQGSSAVLDCSDKFGEAVKTDPSRAACDFSRDYQKSGSRREEDKIEELLEAGDPAALFRAVARRTARSDFEKLRWTVERIVSRGSNGNFECALETLTLLNDRRYATGRKKRSSVLEIVRSGIDSLLEKTLLLNGRGSGPPGFRRIDWKTRSSLRPPRGKEKVLVIDGSRFDPEGEGSDAALLVKAYGLGWERFIVYKLRGQRFHGCGLGAGADRVRIDLYGSSGDYAASGLDGPSFYIHGDAQDQLGQILKQGKLVVYGNVGQTFMYGSKGGTVYVMGSAAGRPLINAVGRPRVVINGTCLDYLAESFMAGDPFNGGGFVVVNGVEFDEDGDLLELPLPYPGSNLFSLASGGALYIRDPKKTLVEEQLNGGRIAKLDRRDWELIEPYLKENEALFNIKIKDLLTVKGRRLPPEKVYRKILPAKVAVLARELADEDEVG